MRSTLAIVLFGLSIIFLIIATTVVGGRQSIDLPDSPSRVDSTVNNRPAHPKKDSTITDPETKTEVSAAKPTAPIEDQVSRPASEDPPDQLVERLFKIDGLPKPKAVAFSPDNSEIWIASLMNEVRGVIVRDAETGEAVADITLPDGGAVELLFNQHGDRLYASQMETGRVFEIDTATKKIKRILETGSTWTKVMALSDDETRLYATNWTANDISEIDLETGRLIRRIPTVKTPRGLYVSADDQLYVAGFANGEIQTIDLTSGTKKILHRTGGAMRHIIADEERGVLFLSDMGQGRIYQLDLATNQVETFVSTDTNPNTIALSPDNKVLIVSNRGRNNPISYHQPGPEWGSVLLFDARTGHRLDAVVGGNQPTGLAISPAGDRFAYSNFLDNELWVYRLPTYSTLRAGDGGRSEVYRSELKKP